MNSRLLRWRAWSRVHFLLALLSLAVASPRVNATDYRKLVDVAFAEGDAYLRLRDSLLEEMTEPWDVAAATAHSWQAGLAAFILNQRREAPDVCARWDKRSYRPKRGGFWYSLHGAPAECALAFLWEKFWKGENEGVRNAAYHDLHNSFGSRFYGLGDAQLWLAVWDHVEDERFRHLTIKLLASSGDTAPNGVVAAVLSAGERNSVALRHACLKSLNPVRRQEAARIVLDSWNQLYKHSALRGACITLLNSQQTAETKSFIRSLVLDPTGSDYERISALVGSADTQLLLDFLKSDISLRLRRTTLERAHGWNLQALRPAVRYVLENETDRGLIGQAVSTLALCYRRADPQGTATDPETAEDVRLIDAAIERIGSPEGMKRSRDFCVRTIEGYRGPLIGDKWPWERPPGGGE